MFQPGDKVKIVPKWRDNLEDETIYEVLEWNIDRGFIASANWYNNQFSIRPRELVRENMIEKI
jgi:hypothetical protein